MAKLTNAVAVAIFDADTFGELTVGPMRLAPSHAGLEGPIGGRLRQLAHAARRSARVEVERRGDLTVVAAPIAVHGKAIGVLATGLVIADESLSSFVVILQLIAGHVALWETNQDSRTLEQEAAATAALLELVGELSRCETVREAATTAANAVREQVGCDCVAIGLARNPKQPSRLVAVSSVADVDSQAEVGRLIESVIEEARVTRVPLEWFAENQSDSATLTVGACGAAVGDRDTRRRVDYRRWRVHRRLGGDWHVETAVDKSRTLVFGGRGSAPSAGSQLRASRRSRPTGAAPLG